MPHVRESDVIKLILGSISVILTLAIAIIIFFVSYQKRLHIEQLRQQSIERGYQRQLLTSSIDIQEKERIRIGQDLHDEIGSSLAAIKMLVSQVTSQDEESVKLIEIANQGLGNAITDVRNISSNLFPSVLSQFGLPDALRQMVQILSTGGSVDIGLTTDNFFSLSFEFELAVYRIIQELVNNSLKHAKPETLEIMLHQSGNNLLLTVEDNGCGFDTEKIKDLKQAGIGMKSIQTRLAILQADMQIISEKFKGTAFKIVIPLQS